MSGPRTFVDPAEAFAGTVLILAPHMDDEVLACGGTVARMPHPNRVHVAYASDGSRSPVPPAPWIGRPSPDLPARRMREAREAMASLGVPAENLHFLGLPDGRLSHRRADLGVALRHLGGRLAPRWVFLPFRYDRHPDHLAVSRAGAACFAKPGGPDLLEYFVYWRWRLLGAGDVRAYLHPEDLLWVDISAVTAAKRRALERFHTQTRRLFPWQARPNLTAELLEEASRGPEVFLRGSPDRPGPAVFRSGSAWIRAVHRVELPLKREKDRLVALWRAREAWS